MTHKTDNYTQQVKICPVCQRPFHNRKKWAQRGSWQQIIYCSQACRRQRPPV